MATSASDQPLIAVKNPVTGEVIGSVPNHTPDQVQAAVERARAAQPAWNARGVKDRARLLRRWADALWNDRNDLIGVIRRETGKNETGALLEVIVLDNALEYYAYRTPRLLRPRKRRTLFPLVQYARVYYRPHGVAGFITPWNYPYLNALLDVVPALVAGNAIVIKPSEITPFSAIRAVEFAHRAGIPQDVIQVVTGDGRTGAALVDYVDCIAVTGSTATGRSVAKRAAERLIPCSLELGGKDPLIVLDDVDLDLAATSVLRGALENAGQVCVSTERVYVLESVYDRFIERLCHHAEKLTIGPGDGLDVHVGSMTNEREVKRCEDQIADAVAKGARVVFGGQRRPDLGPLFFEPAILVDVDHTMEVMREETFGPIVPVMRVSSVDEAVRLANDSRYGLSGAVFTGDLKRGERIACQMDSGDVSVNRTQFVVGTPSLPMGGQKDSGLGRRG
ncbi:MAG: aldehyde dehydrogenase family protein, partial [Anaerolineae bacterium]|nr:aldehyde dehydrogenase family protein [Anaerolineae bacterium]